jgi:hypothetical protein
VAQPIALIRPERFWRFVPAHRPTDECWLWLGRIDTSGYGEYKQYASPGRKHFWRAHRVAYELLVGPIPEGLVIDHLCRVRDCVNPAHMEPVTSAENTRRGSAVGRSGATGAHLRRAYVDGVGYICRYGHVMTPQNTFVDRRGYWICRTCRYERHKEWVERNAA